MKNGIGLKIVKALSLDKKFLQSSKQQMIARNLNVLQSGVGNEKQLYRIYLAKKVEYALWAIVVTVIAVIALWLNSSDKGELDGSTITRDRYEGNEKNISLIAKSEGLEEKIELFIEPLHYSKEQLDLFAEEIFEYIPQNCFSDSKVTGEGKYIIKNHLKLPFKIEDYPFELSWNSSDSEVMDSDGIITIKNAKEPQEVILTVTLSCYEYCWEKEYTLMVYEVKDDWTENFSKRLEEEIEELDNSSADEEKLVLPEIIEGHSIVYEEKSENTAIIVLFLGAVLFISLWILPDNNLTKQTEERNKQLLVDYTKLVSKLTLFMGAGLSFRSAICKIAKSADKSRFYAKELEVVIRELENGISEQKAISGLAERCKIPCYIKLAVLLNQNIRKGNNLQNQLKEEMNKAFEERKKMARKYGEEAGTKLLFPMILMLLVVMVMIMYPAFVSFTI
ncbi:MAG: type II secretion system F family protein [Lachnospiraceae bacterium]|nr:type II secretion system F family protein [Lachnospiraceae bacterium]